MCGSIVRDGAHRLSPPPPTERDRSPPPHTHTHQSIDHNLRIERRHLAQQEEMIEETGDEDVGGAEATKNRGVSVSATRGHEAAVLETEGRARRVDKSACTETEGRARRVDKSACTQRAIECIDLLQSSDEEETPPKIAGGGEKQSQIQICGGGRSERGIEQVWAGGGVSISGE
jgi:hypothetical protein